MSQQSVLTRINFLEGDIHNLKLQIDKSEDGSEVVLLQEQIKEKEIRIDENKQWLRVLERDPMWGSLQNIDGKYVPKLPEFKTQKEVDYALANPQHLREEDADTTEQQFLSTREVVKREHNQLALHRMDGDGPIAAEESDAN